MVNLPTICLETEQQESSYRKLTEGQTQLEATLACYRVLFVFWFVCFYFIEERRLICFFNYDGGFQAMPLMSNHCDHGRNFAIRKVNKICRIIPIKECWLISVSIAVTSCKFWNLNSVLKLLPLKRKWD